MAAALSLIVPTPSELILYERGFVLPKRALALLALIVSFVGSMNSIALAQSTHEEKLTHTPEPAKSFAFEVFSMHPHKAGTPIYTLQYLPNGYHATVAIKWAIMLAYFPQPMNRWSASKIINAPDWTENELYDVDARVAPSDEAAWQKAQDGYDSPLLHLAWQAALRDRCKLQFHTATVDAPYLDLMVSSSGARLSETQAGSFASFKRRPILLGKGFYLRDTDKVDFVGVSMDEFVNYLSRLSKDYPIQNKTGLNGRYDFTLPLINDEADRPSQSLSSMPVSPIGLSLRRGVGSALNLTIDHIERPDQN
ncbi:TIGR03435 family protein [Terriglobus sp. ADX1]